MRDRPSKPFKRLLLTGAAGGLGKMLRPRLREWTDVLRVSDIANVSAAEVGEEVAQVDLADRSAVDDLLADVDVVLHYHGDFYEGLQFPGQRHVFPAQVRSMVHHAPLRVHGAGGGFFGS